MQIYVTFVSEDGDLLATKTQVQRWLGDLRGQSVLDRQTFRRWCEAAYLDPNQSHFSKFEVALLAYVESHFRNGGKADPSFQQTIEHLREDYYVNHPKNDESQANQRTEDFVITVPHCA